MINPEKELIDTVAVTLFADMEGPDILVPYKFANTPLRAETDDVALILLTVAEVADTLPANAEVELRSVNLADTPLIAAEETLVAAEMFVADIFCINAEGADTADNALSPLTNPDVPDIVTPKDEVALKSTTLVAAEKLTAPVTVPPDNGKYAPPPAGEL